MPEDFETRYEKFKSLLIRFLYKRFFISVPSRTGVSGKRRIFSKALSFLQLFQLISLRLFSQ